MGDLSERAWITSLSQHRLGCMNVVSTTSVKRFSSRQLEMAGMSDVSQPGDMQEWRSEELAWAVALEAQSCAYLALELQALAQILSEQLITCPESTYRQLLDSHETFRGLLECMTASTRESIANGSDHTMPALSLRMVGEIRAMLALDRATTTGGSTTSTGRVGT
jgi:hypothetical protein